MFKADKPQIAVSSKIDKAGKKRIKELLEQEYEKNPHDYCVIARTNCGFAEEDTILDAYRVMQNSFDQLLQKARTRTCFSCIYSGSSPISALLDQVPAYEYEEIVTDLEEV